MPTDTLLPAAVTPPLAVAPGLTVAEHQARLTHPSRLAALRATGLLDGAASPVLDRLARLATRLLDVPIALVSLVDDAGQHFPGMSGLAGRAADARHSPLSQSLCQHVVATDRLLLIEDAARHPLGVESLAFTQLGVVAYAGVPLRTAEGETLGALCAIATAPTYWTADQVATLEDLSAAAVAEIELRATARALLASQAQLEAAHDRLRALAVRDGLTGLLNRHGFADVARQQAALADRTGLPFVIAVLDLDGFKAINDTHGHDVGDEALIEMAAVLKATCRTSDVVARLGGDEFALMLTNTTPAQGEVVRSRLEAALAARNGEPGREYALATSVGMAASEPAARESLAALLRAADQDMYAHKRRRRAARAAGPAAARGAA